MMAMLNKNCLWEMKSSDSCDPLIGTFFARVRSCAKLKDCRFCRRMRWSSQSRSGTGGWENRRVESYCGHHGNNEGFFFLGIVRYQHNEKSPVRSRGVLPPCHGSHRSVEMVYYGTTTRGFSTGLHPIRKISPLATS